MGYEFAYYNGFGALMAVLTPDLWESFPSPSTVQFFVGHCGILIAVIFLTCTNILRPRKGSAWRTFVAVNILAAIVAVLDVATGTNFQYLAAKPRTASILDYLGPWPFYLIASEALMLLIFSLMELPFRNTGSRRREPARANNPFHDSTSSLLGIRIPTAKS